MGAGLVSGEFQQQQQLLWNQREVEQAKLSLQSEVQTLLLSELLAGFFSCRLVLLLRYHGFHFRCYLILTCEAWRVTIFQL